MAGLAVPANQVIIRMYGQGVGDCFLLSLPRSGAADGSSRVYVVIDCGVIGRTPGGKARMQTIVRDISDTTNAHVDLLVVTHEHWDHISGFEQANEEWVGIQVDELWMAWTDKPEAGLPDVLQKFRKKQLETLEKVSDQAIALGLSERQDTVLGLMSFLSDAESTGQPFSLSPNVADALNKAKKLVDEDKHVFCEPGDVRRVPGTDSVAYVLGPPRDEELLRLMNPSRKEPETYEEPATHSGDENGPVAGGAAVAGRAFSLSRMADEPSAFNAFRTAVLGLSTLGFRADATEIDDSEDRQHLERAFPFDASVRVPLPTAEAGALNSPAYPALSSYFDGINSWRRIDFDWMGAAEAFALQADNLTNNTSLVLAFELPSAGLGQGKVLLFAADAQVGNWLSWDQIPAWVPRSDVQPPAGKPDIADLLGRAAFYKVGHHGSHNATLKGKGVERMPEDGSLTAFVPVSPLVARSVMGWCEMPLDTLLNALSERTRNRVVLANGNIWPLVAEDALDKERARVGFQVSDAMLPPKKQGDEELEGEVPLWVQVAIGY